MGITVIPSLASSNLPSANGQSATAGSDGIAGEFAALLSGEILGLLNTTASTRNTTSPLAAPGEDNAGQAEGTVDPALLATLFGPGTDVAPERKLHSDTAPLGDTTEDTVGDALRGSKQALLAADESSGGRRKTADAAGLQDKATTFNLPSITSTQQRPAAANIAADSNTVQLPPVATGNGAPHAATPLETSQASPQRSSVNAHLHSAAWPQQFGDKVVWLAKNDQQSAQLTINPPQLGPIQITLNLNGDQANIAFASPHAEVRQAIESALPQLKEMLSSAGINLGQSNVGANLSQQRPDNPSTDANGARLADENAILPANDKAANAAGGAILQRGRGLVDLFA